tara:strand:- start:232 stop:867 length:636 start_codon:yes stop_codon:yes gene_type:complete
LLTPAKSPVILPNEKVARSIAKEWRVQGDEVRPEDMPITRLAISAIDRITPARERILAQISRFGETDLLCYRSEQADLADRQAELWQPILDWAANELNIPLCTISGIMPVQQRESSVIAMRSAVKKHDNMELAALHAITTATGSLILALAVSVGEIDAESAWKLSQLDEIWQAERWGEDSEASERSTHLKRDLTTATYFLHLCRDTPFLPN